MLSYLSEAKRVLKPEGVLIALTGREHLFTHDGSDLKVDCPQNQHLKSGDLTKTLFYSSGIEFTAYSPFFSPKQA